jgi:ankyrin repeat protein
VFWRRKALTADQRLVNALAAHDRQEAVRQLAAGADANACDRDGVPALAIVASSQWPEATEVLLSHGANPNTLLHIPARGLNHAPVLGLPAANGSVAILRCLFLAGARRDAADATGLTALISAAYMGHPDVVSVLIAHVMRFCPQ